MLDKDYKLQIISDYLEKNGLLEFSNATIETMFNDINAITTTASQYENSLKNYCDDNNLSINNDELKRACKMLDNKYIHSLTLIENFKIVYDLL